MPSSLLEDDTEVVPDERAITACFNDRTKRRFGRIKLPGLERGHSLGKTRRLLRWEILTQCGDKRRHEQRKCQRLPQQKSMSS